MEASVNKTSKLLFINSLDKRYGSTYRFRNLFSLVKKRGFEATYVESNCEDFEGAVSVSQKDSLLGYLLATIKRTLLCFKLDYDILVVQKFIPLTVPCILAAKLGGKRVIVDWDDIDTSLQSDIFRKTATFLCETFAPLLAETITTHSLNIADLAQKRFRKKAFIIDQGVDFSLFDPAKYSSDDLKASRGLTDRFVLGYLCTLTHGGSKDIDIILIAFREALKMNPNLLLLIIGGGPREAAIRNLVGSLGIEKNMLITGLVPQNMVPGYISMCDISLVYMRDDEGNRARVSFKVLESLAMNRTVLGHLVGETDQRFGKYIKDVGRDIINFKKMILDNSKGKLPSENSRDELLNIYSWEKIGDNFARLIGVQDNLRD